jgi:hypothetical protein
MSELFKSKVGWLLAGIHLLMVLICLLYLNFINSGNVIVTLVLMILTAPWWIIMVWVNFKSGIITGEALHGGLLFNFYAVVSALINAFILYLLGFLLTKAFNYLSSRK